MVRIFVALPFKLLTLVITNLGTIANPSHLSLLVSHHRKYCRFHAVIKQGKSFHHIYYIKFNVGALWNVSDAEEKPLIVSFGIYIVL